MSEYESLREDIAAFAEQSKLARDMSVHHLLEQSRQIDKLWADNAALRDELHAVSNQLENLTRAVTTSPAEVVERGSIRLVDDLNTAS